MTGPLYLAWQYLRYHKLKTALLVLSISLIAFLPAGLNVVVGESARQLTARAEATPLLVGARGSPMELALSSLYFESRAPQTIPFSETARIAQTGLARAIPLQLGFRAAGQPIVGTALGYFDVRGLRVERGRMMAVLGECVIGAETAQQLAVGPGDAVVTSPDTLFDLAGAYPLKLRVTGVLARAQTPDDRAVFVDVKTAWVIAGLGHGHRDLAEAGASSAVLRREEGPGGERIVANASVREYNEITPENAGSFHFHGDPSGYPITAVLAVPPSERERALLMGRYAGPDRDLQVLRPSTVIDELLSTVFTVRGYVVAALGIVGAATLLTAALVFALSLRLREREVETLHKIGAARASVAVILAAEVVAVLGMAAAVAALLTLLTQQLGAAAIRSLLLS